MIENRIYKKYNTQKDKQYNLLAIEYLQQNHIKFTKCAWIGMAGNIDLIKANGKVYKFDINTKKELKALKLLYKITRDELVKILISWYEEFEEIECAEETNEFYMYDDVIKYIYKKYKLEEA